SGGCHSRAEFVETCVMGGRSFLKRLTTVWRGDYSIPRIGLTNSSSVTPNFWANASGERVGDLRIALPAVTNSPECAEEGSVVVFVLKDAHRDIHRVREGAAIDAAHRRHIAVIASIVDLDVAVIRQQVVGRIKAVPLLVRQQALDPGVHRIPTDPGFD